MHTMKRKTRGQIVGQVFIYMMAIIVIGGIAIMGYYAINKIVKKSCDVEKATFKMDMEGLIEKYTSYDSGDRKTIKAPCEYDTICFVDASRIGPTTEFGCNDNKLIYNSVRESVQQNIFVMSSDRTIPIGYNELISLNSSDAKTCLCIKQRNKNFYIRFLGRGSTVEISSG
jgi:hypothetical protein